MRRRCLRPRAPPTTRGLRSREPRNSYWPPCTSAPRASHTTDGLELESGCGLSPRFGAEQCSLKVIVDTRARRLSRDLCAAHRGSLLPSKLTGSLKFCSTFGCWRLKIPNSSQAKKILGNYNGVNWPLARPTLAPREWFGRSDSWLEVLVGLACLGGENSRCSIGEKAPFWFDQ